MQRLAHAVQTLEFEIPPPASPSTVATVSALWVANCGNSAAARQQLGAGDVVQVGLGLRVNTG